MRVTSSSVSAGGELVVFDSVATNLDQQATSSLSQIYERRNCFGVIPNCTPQTTLISVAADGSAGAGGTTGSQRPVVSPDGRLVAFESDDTNLVAGVTRAVGQIYLRDTCNSIFGPIPSCTPQTSLVSMGVDGKPGNAPSGNPAVSGFGLFVAYQSTATNLTSMAVPVGVQQVYLYQNCPANSFPGLGQTGGMFPGCTPTTSVASLDSSGKPGDKDSINPSLDLIGLSVAFESLAYNIVGNMPGNGFHQVYLRSLCLNLPIPATAGGAPPCGANARIAVSVDVQGNLATGGDSITPSAAALGAVVAFCVDRDESRFRRNFRLADFPAYHVQLGLFATAGLYAANRLHPCGQCGHRFAACSKLESCDFLRQSCSVWRRAWALLERRRSVGRRRHGLLLLAVCDVLDLIPAGAGLQRSQISAPRGDESGDRRCRRFRFVFRYARKLGLGHEPGNLPGCALPLATFSWHRSRVHVHGGARVLLRAKLICPRPKHPAGSARHKAAGNQSQHLADVRRR